MASSKVMPTTTTTSSTTSTATLSDLHFFNHSNSNPNYLFNSSQMIPDLHNSDVSPINVDGLFSNGGDGNDEITLLDAAGAISAVDCADASTIRRKTAEDVWREIVEGGEKKECKVEVAAEDAMMTLEDFLARATAEDGGDGGNEVAVAKTEEESVGIGMHGVVQFPMAAAVGGGGGGGRGKRSRGSGGGGGGGGGGMMMVETLDKASQQRQRRMIKNRESAARSRERKQAYQVELEALAAKLEEENELLLKEKADRTKQRYTQLMEKVIPVIEKRRPARTLRRVQSMQW